MKRALAMTMLFGFVVVLAMGCATAPKGLSDEEMISKRVQECVTAIKAKNLDALAALVSKSFDSAAVGDRQGLIDYLKNADSMGFLDNLEVDLSAAKTVVAGQKATVAPVTANGSFGSITLNFEGAKENGNWVISGLEPGY